MNRPLTGCALTGRLKRPAQDFSPVVSSLLYQSAALGMKVEARDAIPANAPLSFEFETPYTVPVNCVVTRWDDPFRQAPVTENTIQAACGLMSVHGRALGKPRALGLNYVSTLTAALALHGGIAAAIGQLRGLPLSSSYVSMASAALLSMGQYIAGATASESPERLSPGSVSHPAAPPFVSADGVVFELETLDAGPWQRFWAEAGVSSTAAGKGWTAFLTRYAKAISPVPEELISTLSNLTYRRISAICAATGMSICPERSLEERADDEEGKLTWLRGPWAFHFEPSPNGASLKRATDDLPLSGLTVIESCRRIQGPLAGHLLALLGADVIRIEPLGGDPLRGMPPMAEGCSARFDALNRHKTVLQIDLKSSAGQADIKEMARHADVFLHNWAPGNAARFGLDHGDLAAVNPSLVYAYAAGWATQGKMPAALGSLPGTDFMTQAYSGVAKKIAGVSGANGGSLFTVLDVLGGVVAAQGITIALLNRCLHNAGAKVTSSLLSSATLLCADDFRDLYLSPAAESAPKSVIDAVYDTRQGRIAIECRDEKTSGRLAEALDIAIGAGEAGFRQRLEESLLARTADEWAEVLGRVGVPSAVVAEDLADLQYDARLRPSLSPGSYTHVNSPWSFK